MQMNIFLQSGINGNGFRIKIEDEYDEMFNYGQNASCDRGLESDSQPFVSDILVDLMIKYHIDPIDVRINEFKNEYGRNKITKNNFIDDYFREAIRRYNKFQQDRRMEELDRRLGV